MYPLFFLKTCLCLCISSLFLFACKTTEKASNNKPDAFSDAYYQNMSNNLERLQMLQAGLFVQYSENQDSSLTIWSLNDSEDSMILYVFPVGDPNKNGYWLYGHQFISNLPDAPVYSTFIKVENLNRDTFVARYYKAPQTYSWERIKKNDIKNVAFDKLEASGELIYFTKVTNSHFEGVSGFYDNPVAGENNYRQDIYTLKPDRVIFEPKSYDSMDDKEGSLISDKQHLLRLKRVPSHF